MTLVLTKYYIEKKNHMVQISQLNISLDDDVIRPLCTKLPKWLDMLNTFKKIIIMIIIIMIIIIIRKTRIRIRIRTKYNNKSLIVYVNHALLGFFMSV